MAADVIVKLILLHLPSKSMIFLFSLFIHQLNFLIIYLGNECERCNCFGHADQCYFDPIVEAERKSLNSNGKYLKKIIIVLFSSRATHCRHMFFSFIFSPFHLFTLCFHKLFHWINWFIVIFSIQTFCLGKYSGGGVCVNCRDHTTG